MSLPKGWAETRLGDVCELLNGRAYKKHELLPQGRYPVLRVGNFFTSDKWYYSDLELEPAKYCDNGDLLYAWSASFGPRIWTGGKVIYHYHIWRTRLAEEALDKQFLFYWFEWDKENIKAAHGTGTTMIHVTKGDMENREVCLPPLAEQRRIAAKLDALTARLTRARAELDRVPVLAERLRKKAIDKALGGGYPTVLVGDLLTDIRYGTAKKCDYGSGDTSVLRIPNVQAGKIDLSDLKSASFDSKEKAKLELRAGDVLVIRSNGSLDLVGRSAVVDDQSAGMLFAGYLIRMRTKLELCTPDFLHLFLQSEIARDAITFAAKSTSGVNNVNSQQLQALEIPLPNLATQKAIVSDVAMTFARADRLEAEAAKARALLDRMEAAILARAFRGELVPQDPADEPASVLLDRIRAKRAAAPKPKRGRRKKAEA